MTANDPSLKPLPRERIIAIFNEARERPPMWKIDRLAEIVEQLESAQREIADLKKELENKWTVIPGELDSVSLLKRELESAQREIKKLREWNNAYCWQQLESAQRENHTLKEKVEVREDRMVQLVQEITSLKKEIQELKNEK